MKKRKNHKNSVSERPGRVPGRPRGVFCRSLAPLMVASYLPGAGSRFGRPREPKCSPKGPSWRLRGRILGSILGRFLDICASFFRHLFWHPFLRVFARFRTNFASIWGSILCDFAQPGLVVSTPRKPCACRSDQGSGVVENVLKCIKNRR